MESRSFTSHATAAEAAVDEVASQITSEPLGIIFFCDYDWIEEVSQKLHSVYPKAAIIGTAGTYYHGTEIEENKSLTVATIQSGAVVYAGVIKHLATAPLSDMKNLTDGLQAVRPGKDDTVLFEFCTNNEEVLVSSLNMELSGSGVSLVGGTVFGTPDGKESKVSVNGKVYANACSFILIRNTSGRVFTYRENIYGIDKPVEHVATKVNLADKEVIELDNRPAADVYSDETGVPKDRIIDNVLQAPLGRVIGEDIYVASMKELRNSGSFTMYKRVNVNDHMYILKLLDYSSINHETINRVRENIPSASLVLSANCIYRYLLFNQEGYMTDVLRGLSSAASTSVGYIAGGEQFGKQHMNQTMVMAVFE